MDTWVVDGANVVGARPDGWWRDRAAAAARLDAGLRRLRPPERPARVILVLEGAACHGVPERPAPHPVQVVHAGGEGDDEIVRQVERATATAAGIVVVTADRALRVRVAAIGADVEGPRRLWERIDATHER